MSTPNEFISSTHTFHQENVAPLVIQAAHSNSNFPPASNTNNGTHFNGGGGFLSNSINYDVTMLPLFHHNSQRAVATTAHFNSSSFTGVHQGKQTQSESVSKEELTSHIPSADGRTNTFGTETINNSSSGTQYWSRQSQLSPFGVLPHEISPEHMEEKSPYETVLNAHFTAQSFNSLNQLTNVAGECGKKTQITVVTKSKETNVKKQYIQKSINEVKLNSAVTDYNHDDINFRNGVINHSGHTVTKIEQSKLIGNVGYKSKQENDPISLVETVSTVPRDYRVFKPPVNLFSNPSPPLIKYTDKPAKQYLHKQLVANKSQQHTQTGISPVMKSQRITNVNGSPMMCQKISDFPEDGQSSPISLTSDDISEQHQYSSSSESNLKNSETESSFHGINHMNNAISLTNPTNSVSSDYREATQMHDINCSNDGDKNKVTNHPFLKLPYTMATNVQNNVVISEACHLNRKASFGPLYIMYNNTLNVPAHSTLLQKRMEKPIVASNERLVAQQPHQSSHIHTPSNVKLSNVANNSNNQNQQITGMVKSAQNGLIGYPSVIMRTDRNYENEEKAGNKSPRRMLWSGTDRNLVSSVSPIKSDKLLNYNAKNETISQTQSTLPDHHHLLLSLTERQHSYFDTTPCSTQIPAQPTGVVNVKCNPKNLNKNMYNETQQRIDPQQQSQPQPQLHHQVSQNVEQLHHYQQQQQQQQQQYMQVNNKNQIPLNQPLVETTPETMEKMYNRKRKPSKSNNSSAPVLENRMSIPSEYISRDPPPAHINVYQQPLQNGNYTMDSNRYDMSKIYPSHEQFYSQTNLNNYNVTTTANVTLDNHQHQSVIASHTTSSSNMRLSPSVNSQLRQISQMPPTLPLSAYFSSFHSTSPHYSHSEFPTNPQGDTLQSCNLPNEVPSSFPENTNTSKLKKEVYDSGRIKVVVPNVEEEFKFLFDSQLPHFKQIASLSEDEIIFKKPLMKPTFYRKNIDFLASYIKFLENNCESVETLTDSSSSTMKNWNRSKVLYQPVNKEKEENNIPTTIPASTSMTTAITTVFSKESLVKTNIKEPECNFENDPRYYPLPKSSDKRRLCDSSSEEEMDNTSRKVKLTLTSKKSFIADMDKKKMVTIKKEVRNKKEMKMEKRKESKKILKKEARKESKKEMKIVKTKLEKLEKAKKKIEKLKKKNYSAEKLKPKMEKALAEMKSIKQSFAQQQHQEKQKKISKNSVKEIQKLPARRKVSERKVKDNLKSKNNVGSESEDDVHANSDSDPLWTPKEDEDENMSKRRSTRIRSVRLKTKISKKSSEPKFKRNFQSNANTKKQSKNNTTESSKIMKTSETSTKVQKLSEFNLSKYQEVNAVVIENSKDRIIVELCEETDIPTDVKIKENFMKESLCYEHQFAVYIQTLVSQALDSNFLSEIVKENDIYFLNNMKVIDEVTATYLTDLTSVVKWGTGSVDILVKTWPFVSIKNIRIEFVKSGDRPKCASCINTNAKQTAIFYGQPYQRETLQGCKANSCIPNDMDKTINLCGSCVREIKLFNKIWHQKYHVFVECAKYVSKKKSDDKSKGTTDILNELLADNNWLSKELHEVLRTCGSEPYVTCLNVVRLCVEETDYWLLVFSFISFIRAKVLDLVIFLVKSIGSKVKGLHSYSYFDNSITNCQKVTYAVKILASLVALANSIPILTSVNDVEKKLSDKPE
ncbi:hypothetical protein PGB90_008732 [Kerria lacca]